jgi:hypothetical protein
VRNLAATICGVLWVASALGAEANGRENAADLQRKLVHWTEAGQPVAEAIRLLHVVNAELRAGAKETLLDARRTLFHHACDRANPAELQALAEMIPEFGSLEGPEWLGVEASFEECVLAYAKAAFEHEVRKLQARPAKLEMPLAKGTLPPVLVDAPKQFEEAWRAWQGAMEAYQALDAAAAKAAAEAKETVEPRHRVAALRRLGPTPEPGLWRELLQQDHQVRRNFPPGEWEDWQPTGRARHLAIILSLMADGRMQEAVGAVCAHLRSGEDYVAPGRKGFAALAREILIARGLDWELICGGFLVSERLHSPGQNPSAALANREVWLMLAALGSARGVQLGLDWIRHSGMGSGSARPYLLQALGPAPAEPKIIPGRSPQRRKILPPKVRADAASILGGFLAPGNGTAELHRTLEEIPPWLAEDLNAPLQRLLGHRSHVIAARALWLLRNAGLADPETTIALPPPPIRLRVMQDGKPLASTSVVIRANGMERSLTTASDGELALSLHDVLEPERIDAVSLFAGPRAPKEQAGRQAEEGHDRQAKAGEIWQGPWFSLTTPVTIGAEAAKVIGFETGEIEIGLNWNAGVPPAAKIHLTLQKEGDPFRFSVEAAGQPGQSVVFQKVQVGKYRLFVHGVGLAQSDPQTVHATKAGSLKLIELHPGRDVEAELMGTDGMKYLIAENATLYRDGAEVSPALHSRGPRWEGLPLGRYRARIPSSAELVAEREKRGGVSPIARNQRHAAHEVEFELTPESPSVVNLGVIRLKPED